MWETFKDITLLLNFLVRYTPTEHTEISIEIEFKHIFNTEMLSREEDSAREFT